jgi:hypothetical protein
MDAQIAFYIANTGRLLDVYKCPHLSRVEKAETPLRNTSRLRRNASGLHHGNAAKDAADNSRLNTLQLTILADTERQTFNLDMAPTVEATLAIKRCERMVLIAQHTRSCF